MDEESILSNSVHKNLYEDGFVPAIREAGIKGGEYIATVKGDSLLKNGLRLEDNIVTGDYYTAVVVII